MMDKNWCVFFSLLAQKSIKHHLFTEHHWWCFQTSYHFLVANDYNDKIFSHCPSFKSEYASFIVCVSWRWSRCFIFLVIWLFFRKVAAIICSLSLSWVFWMWTILTQNKQLSLFSTGSAACAGQIEGQEIFSLLKSANVDHNNIRIQFFLSKCFHLKKG